MFGTVLVTRFKCNCSFQQSMLRASIVHYINNYWSSSAVETGSCEDCANSGKLAVKESETSIREVCVSVIVGVMTTWDWGLRQFALNVKGSSTLS
ncbi:hypothetical protein PF005_g33682 [Phytophthora fragariae]|uniref:Uncharacterized protein n=1 Tax=Phytophthora fragariae TaxID=53985 RepID=A0A6A3DDH3_9STRA|nr:hypothetical protein PF009_g32717 [Phytophthora fragariae]KAE9054650.1 hypothetical protein PF010_g32444 [Phytophthora fragariae]KAE9055383.1 hypothetical protein PF007_g32337 [Phytophthora fragariae]KAE9056206.1 hypothetical protein PF006_g32746 [Phytophthora fragariae]KAE9145158.1 hypothetical protein PF005_g33682 [Phytophthora fragariae]